jgi:ribosomal protein S18 acetylase RimI-like enzyme
MSDAAPAMDLRRLEEIALNASNTPRQILYDGWLLRLSPGQAKRPRSVNPFYGSSVDLDVKLAYCAAVYAKHDIPLLFRLSRFVHPEELDRELDARGYRRFDETLVQLAPLTRIQIDAEVEVVPDLDQWMRAFAALRGLTATQAAAVQEQLACSLHSRHAVAIYADGAPLACGMALLEDGVAGLFNISTADHARGRGHATRVTQALLAWAARAGAHSAYLQVNGDNAPALALYRKFGFATAYTYWYRSPPGPA